jgi:hypothetical protein
MESQEQSSGDVVTVGEDSHPITQAIDTVEVTHAGATTPLTPWIRLRFPWHR